MKKFLVIAAMLFSCMAACSVVVVASSMSSQTDSTGSSLDNLDSVDKPVVKESSKPKISKARLNAVRSAQDYVDLMDFSKEGLFHQLSASTGDHYKESDARYAVNHIKVDWNEEAYGSAKSYQELMPMSRSGLIHQLTSSAGDKYTKAQAVYAANKLKL